MSSLECIASVVEVNASDYTLTRYPEGSYVEHGRWQEQDLTTQTIEANIQPVTGKELEDLPEGRITKDIIKIYTLFALQTNCPADKTQADVIEFNSKKYEISTVQNWDKFYKGIGTLIERTER